MSNFERELDEACEQAHALLNSVLEKHRVKIQEVLQITGMTTGPFGIGSCLIRSPLLVEKKGSDHTPEINRLRRERDELAARIKPGVAGVKKLRVRLEQVTTALMELELKQ